MKLASSLKIVFAIALLAGGSQANLAQSREEKLPHSMKGYELYSWKIRGQWHFALVVGTNRLKSRGEINLPQVRVRGVEALKRKLSRLAGGEEVSWVEGRVPGTVLPPEEIIEEVKGYCDRQGIILRVRERGGSDASNNGMRPPRISAPPIASLCGSKIECAAGDAGR